MDISILDFNKYGDFKIDGIGNLFYMDKPIGRLNMVLLNYKILLEGFKYSVVNLRFIEIDKSNRDKKFGTRCLQQIIDFCDSHLLVITVDSVFSYNENEQLIKWFKSFGFNENTKVIMVNRPLLYRKPYGIKNA